MLIIRPEQIKKFEDNEVLDFENQMAVHIKKKFPEKFDKIQDAEPGDCKVKELIRHGIERASSYKITAEREVRSFLDLLLELGTHFEERNDMAWAMEILKDDLLNQKLKIDIIKHKLRESHSKRN